MIRSADFILNPEKLENEFQLVEVSQWTDFDTKEKLGYNYIVLLPKLQFEKMKVSIPVLQPLISNEELEQKGQIPVVFEGLHTRASLYKNKLSVKANAVNVKKAGVKQ